MIDPSWLGTYWNRNSDDWESPTRELDLFLTPTDALCFRYRSKSGGNHGYSSLDEEGSVESLSETGMEVTIWLQVSSAYEDYYKEHQYQKVTQPKQETVKIRAFHQGRPVFVCGGDAMYFKRHAHDFGDDKEA